jgi:hypothetical protein
MPRPTAMFQSLRNYTFPMQKILLKLLASSLAGLTLCKCSNHNSTSIENWVGEYGFEETAVEANAGYSMVMDWSLSIKKQNDIYEGILEVNGQQTFLKLKMDIQGDASEIAIVYNRVIDGSNEQLKKGDTLFTLTKRSGKLKTLWFKLAPRLLENQPKECNCFETY